MLIPNKKEKHLAKNLKGQDTTPLKKPRRKVTNKALTKQEAILKKYGTMDAYYDAAPIVCKVKKENSLFITAEGLALPCCWTAGRMYKWWHKDPKVEQIWDYIPKKSKLNAKLGLDKVFETGIFEQIQDSWSLSSCEQGKLKVCAMKCGVQFHPSNNPK